MDQKRFILAAALSLGVILVWQKFYAPKPPTPPKGKQKKSAQKSAADAGTTAAAAGPDTGTSAAPTPSKRDTGVASAPESEAGADAGAAADARGSQREGDDSGREALTAREDRAWGACLAALPRKLDLSKKEVEMPWPNPNDVSCTETSCTVASRVDHRTGDKQTSFTCETEDGEVVQLSRGAPAEAKRDKPEAKGSEKTGGEPSVRRRKVSVESHAMHSERVHLTLTNARTGQITSIDLRKPKQYRKRGDLLGNFPKNTKRYPFGIQFKNNSVPIPEGATFEFVESDSKKTANGDSYRRLVYRYEDPKGRFAIDKRFSLSDENPYVLHLDIEVHNNLESAELQDTMVLDIFGYKDPDKETSFLNFRPNEVEGVCRMASEAKRSSFSEMEGPLKYDESEPIWGAIDTRYFMTAAIPEEGAKSCSIEQVGKGYLRTRLTYDGLSVLPGESQTLHHKLYLGPKDIDVLGKIGHKLGSSVDYGLFAFIARPLRWALNFLQGYVVNWGLAIILLTIIIKILTWPINMKAYRNMEDMKEIQPQLEEIRDKYEDDQQRMTEETMKLFRENDVSPMGGCLPMLLQMPILYGLYVMIYSSVELYNAEFFLWYTNLAAPDPYYVLPILMGVVMFVQQGMMTSAGGNMQAKIMSKVMPFMFTGFMLFLPSGLVLYYSVNLIIGLGQQFYIRGFEWPFGDSDEEGES